MVVFATVLVAPSAASACPGDGGPAPADIKNHFCGTWDAAVARGLNMGTPANDAHRYGNGWTRDFDNSGTFGSGVIMEGDGVGYAYIVGNPSGQWYWDAFKASGAVASMGYPVGRHEFGGHLNDGPRGNRYMTFQNGVINSFPGGTHGVHGAIWRKWNATGHVLGGLGQPVSNEYRTAARNGAAQRFEGGYITHNPAVPGEFALLNNAITNKYISTGSSSGPLGLPRSDPFHNNARGNDVQLFDEGQITWHPGGVFETHGLIFRRWAAASGSNGPLGWPLSDEYRTAVGGGAASRFEHGYITYNPRTGQAYATAFAIADKYGALGGSNSYLVLPTSEEFNWEGGKRQNFDGGYIWWHPQIGAYSNLERAGPTGPSTPQGRRPEFYALGDSVSAGFGYDSDGRPLSARQVAHCGGLLKPQTSWPACQSPLNASYPAQFARRMGLPRDLEHLTAVEGSTPEQWWRGPWRQRLDRIVRSKPTLTVLTLGANPALNSIVTPGERGYRCFRAASSGVAAARCATRELNDAGVDAYLPKVYRRLLSVPGNNVAVFLYHDTVPATLAIGRLWPPSEYLNSSYQNGVKARILNDTLNNRVRKNFDSVRNSLPPSERGRFKLLSPGDFSSHYCNNRSSWILRTDSCIHPNYAGLTRFADALQRAYPSVASFSGR